MKIHGLACFETINGLTAFGSGRLADASRHTELFEFTNPKLGGNNYLSASIPTIFIRKFYYKGILAHLVGIVQKSRDSFGRAGFWGVAMMVDDDKPINQEVVAALLDIAVDIDTYEKVDRTNLYHEIIAQAGNYPAGTLDPYDANEVLAFSVEDGKPTDEIFQRSKDLMDIEPSNYSTVIIQLGKVANFTLGELDEHAFATWSERLNAEADGIQHQLKYENMTDHERRFQERTEKIGVTRPEFVNPEFENYLISLIRYVNNSIASKRR